jgi:hypothetical protein
VLSGQRRHPEPSFGPRRQRAWEDSAAPRARNERRFIDDIVVPFKNESDAGEVQGVMRPGQAPQADTTAPLTGAARSLTRKAMMSAAASGRTACARTSAGKTRPVSGGVKKLRGDRGHPDTVRAQLKVEDPDEVA